MSLQLRLRLTAQRTDGGEAVATYLRTVSVTDRIPFGFFKLVSGYSGPCCRLRKASNAESDIGWNGQKMDTSDPFLSSGGPFTLVHFYDQDGLGRNISQTTNGNQTTVYLDGAEPECWVAGSGFYLNIPTSLVTDRQNFAAFLVARQYTTAKNTRYVAFGTTPDLSFGSEGTIPSTIVVRGSAAVTPTPAYVAVPQVNKDIATMISRAAGVTVGCNERLATGAAQTALALSAGGKIGGVTFTNILLRGGVFYATAPTDAEAVNIRADLGTIDSTAAATIDAQVYFWVHSFGVGENPGETLGRNIPRLVADMLGGGTLLHNGGVGAAVLSASYVPVILISGPHKKVVVLLMGINNILLSGQDSATLITRLTAAVANIKTAGAKAVVVTMTPVSTAAWTDTMEGYRLAVNSSVRSGGIGALGMEYFVSDPAIHPTIGVDGSSLADAARSSNIAGQYADKLHPTDATQLIMAALDKAAIDLALVFWWAF